MPIVQFTEEDVLRGKIVDPGWYKIQIGEFAEEVTKSGDSTNYVFRDCKIIAHENGDSKFAGVPIKILFSAKPTARGFMMGFFKALGYEAEPGKRLAIENAAGKEVMAFVETNNYNGNLSNRINHKYKPVSE